jgi:hypothetical protein
MGVGIVIRSFDFRVSSLVEVEGAMVLAMLVPMSGIVLMKVPKRRFEEARKQRGQRNQIENIPHGELVVYRDFANTERVGRRPSHPHLTRTPSPASSIKASSSCATKPAKDPRTR